MGRLVCAFALMAAWGLTAPLAWATAGDVGVTTPNPGVQVELGAVRANVGTLYSVGSIGGPLVSTIGTAGWNTCTSGYSLVGYDFEQNGFWVCAPSDLASGPSVFYVGNVVNNAGYWWEVHGGVVTKDGYQGWDYCPSSGTLLGTEFNSNGFWVCYVAPPPTPSGGGTTTVAPLPSSPPTPTSALPAPVSSPPTPKRHLHHVHVRIVLHWVWKGARTSLTSLQFARLPRDATVIVTCKGMGCPRGRAQGNARHLTRLRSQLVNHQYRWGDHITIKVTVPGAIPEVALIMIRDGRKPVARLLAA